MGKSATFEKLRNQVDERVAARMQTGHWPGVALGIELESEAHVRAYGLANLEHQVPVRADTVFRIGSLTKQFTAALVLKLQEQGQLSIDDDITRPKLTHSGGISGFVGVLSFYLAHDLTIAILVNRFAANPWALDSELARLLLGLPALEIEPVELSSGELGRYVGTYRLRGDPLPVTAESGRLSVLGQRYVPVGGHAFVASDDPESRLEFSLCPGGVESVRMVREGLETLWERGE